ncbi:hypothetical protein MVEN_01742400 [Mycena venus]|uniref:Uncharacterized protein n=1 Tax=Mycena venus TaxID=2733690 RepID=A0A8H7CMF4_9AGAR|nr:hypothetical protein MVEN_01742400 [Mycena venus]
MKTKKRKPRDGSSRNPGLRHWEFCDVDGYNSLGQTKEDSEKAGNTELARNRNDVIPLLHDSGMNIDSIHSSDSSDEFEYVLVEYEENGEDGWEKIKPVTAFRGVVGTGSAYRCRQT